MPVKWLSLNHECHIRKLALIQHAMDADPQAIFLLGIGIQFLDSCIEIRAGISIKNVNILEVILAVATTDNIQFTIDQRHRVACACIRIWIILGIKNVVAVLPGG